MTSRRCYRTSETRAGEGYLLGGESWRPAGGVSRIERGKGKRKYIVGSGNRQHRQGLGIQCNNHFLRASQGQIPDFPEDVLQCHLAASPVTSFKTKLAGSRGNDAGCSAPGQ